MSEVVQKSYMYTNKVNKVHLTYTSLVISSKDDIGIPYYPYLCPYYTLVCTVILTSPINFLHAYLYKE